MWTRWTLSCLSWSRAIEGQGGASQGWWRRVFISGCFFSFLFFTDLRCFLYLSYLILSRDLSHIVERMDSPSEWIARFSSLLIYVVSFVRGSDWRKTRVSSQRALGWHVNSFTSLVLRYGRPARCCLSFWQLLQGAYLILSPFSLGIYFLSLLFLTFSEPF